mgnify:CR=1 FL=1
MSKRLQPMMFEEEFRQVVAESAPRNTLTVTVDRDDVEKAIEFWLNNVLLKHPVKVEFVQALRNGELKIICNPILVKPDKTSKVGEL